MGPAIHAPMREATKPQHLTLDPLLNNLRSYTVTVNPSRGPAF